LWLNDDETLKTLERGEPKMRGRVSKKGKGAPRTGQHSKNTVIQHKKRRGVCSKSLLFPGSYTKRSAVAKRVQQHVFIRERIT